MLLADNPNLQQVVGENSQRMVGSIGSRSYCKTTEIELLRRFRYIGFGLPLLWCTSSAWSSN